MSRSKKIVGLVLAVVLMLGSLTMAFAATDPGAGNYTATVAVNPASATIAAGESTTVTVKATTNFTVGALSVPLFYEKANVTLSNITVPATAGYAYSTEATALNAASIFASAGLDSATYGFVMVTYIPAAGAATKVFADEQVLSFTVTAKAGVADGTAVNFKTVEASRKTSTNPTGTLYVGFINSDTINAVPTNIEATGLVTSSTVTIGSAVTNTLVVKETAPSIPVIDLVNKSELYTGSVYGMDTLGWNDELTPEGAIADYLTTTLGDEYLRITVPECGVETTGTIIEVLDTDKTTVLESYVFVYFGDVDEDGLVGSSDDFIVTYYEGAYAGIDTLEQFMAGDLDGDAWPLAADGFIMTYYEGTYTGMPAQADVAAMASGNIYELI